MPGCNVTRVLQVTPPAASQSQLQVMSTRYMCISGACVIVYLFLTFFLDNTSVVVIPIPAQKLCNSTMGVWIL